MPWEIHGGGVFQLEDKELIKGDRLHVIRCFLSV